MAALAEEQSQMDVKNIPFHSLILLEATGKKLSRKPVPENTSHQETNTEEKLPQCRPASLKNEMQMTLGSPPSRFLSSSVAGRVPGSLKCSCERVKIVLKIAGIRTGLNFELPLFSHPLAQSLGVELHASPASSMAAMAPALRPDPHPRRIILQQNCVCHWAAG